MKLLISSFLSLLLFLVTAVSISAQTQPSFTTEYFKAEAKKVTEDIQDGHITRTITVEVLDGNERGKEIVVTQIVDEKTSLTNVADGQTLVISKLISDNSTEYSIYDTYRLPPLLLIIVGFFLLVILIAGKKGIGAIVGLFVSIGILVYYIVPQILSGANPLFITISGSLLIMLITIYLAHGFSQRTTVAIGGTFISLLLTGFLATYMVHILGLSGLGSEDAALLHVSNGLLNLKGLFLGGIIIGTLGVLDDVTTTQTATIYSLAEANEKYTTKTLIQKGLKIGQEHITSLVNTLVLAYAGASLPIFIFFVLNPLNQPLWLLFNNELIIEEVVRTLAGSIGLILAVPITTVLAAFFAKYDLKIS